MSRRYTTLLCGCLALLSACAKTTSPRTQTTLVVRADPGVQQDAVTLSVAFQTGKSEGSLSDAHAKQSFGNGKPGSIKWPVSLALLGQSGTTRFSATIEARDDADALVARQVVLSGFVEGKTKLLEVVLHRLSAGCADAGCSDGQNCITDNGSASCTDPALLDPNKLPTFTGGSGASGPCKGSGAPDCGAHGTCVANTGTASCECEANYEGDLCDGCALGNVDEGGDCVPACEAKDAPKCKSGETCLVDAKGKAMCGSSCGSGQGPDSNGDCVPLCESVLAPSCDSHGTCDPTTMPLRCKCDSGYQDNDHDGSCQPDCGKSALSCGAHSACDDGSGTAQCACDSGYQDNDGNGDCAANCATAGLTCGKHSACDDGSGTAQCACDSGYQDNDGNGDCSPDCASAGLSCPANATCQDGSGTAQCVCNTGYAGGSCDHCDMGYQDKDGDGSCLPSCAMVDCSNAGTCDDSSGTAICDCDPGNVGDNCESCTTGYVQNGSACDWQDVVVGGDFSSSGDWTTTGTASIISGLNVAQLDQSAECFGGSISQTVDMPAYADSEPLVLTFRARPGATMNGTIPTAVYLNGVPHPIDVGYSTTWVNNTVCLGENDYGGPLTIAFQRAAAASGCTYDPVQLDDVAIGVAASGQCPLPGQVNNGDFSAGGAGWTADVPSSTYGSAITFTSGPTGNAVLTGARCGNATLHGWVSLPTATELPNAALSLKYSTTGTGVLQLSLQGQMLTTLPSGPTTTVHLCVPQWTKGGAARLDISTYLPGGGPCNDTFTATLDDVQVVTDPGCEDAPLLDAGFEGLPASDIEPWTLTLNNNNNAVPGPAIVMDASKAHDGTGYLQMSLSYACTSVSASQMIAAPGPDSGGGPALKYWYYLPALSTASYQVCVANSCDMPPAMGATWTQRTLCIDPTLAGVPVQVQVSGYGGSGACANNYTAETIRVDTLELTTDPSCPAS